MSLEKAQKHLRIARRHLERVQIAWLDPGDAVETVTFAFYGYENGVVAIAELNNRPWVPNHQEKAKLAHRLFEARLISRDVSELLGEFNDLRKDVAYDEPGPELAELDLEDVAIQLEEFVDEVGRLVDEATGE